MDDPGLSRKPRFFALARPFLFRPIIRTSDERDLLPLSAKTA